MYMMILDLPDYSFEIDVPIFLMVGLQLLLYVLAVMVLFWTVKLIISIIQGG